MSQQGFKPMTPNFFSRALMKPFLEAKISIWRFFGAGHELATVQQEASEAHGQPLHQVPRREQDGNRHPLSRVWRLPNALVRICPTSRWRRTTRVEGHEKVCRRKKEKRSQS